MRRRGIGCVACVVVVSAVAPVRAQAADTRIDAASLSVPTSVGAAQPDSDTNSGQALALFANGTATGTFATTQPEVHLSVVARGTQCNGAPNLVATIDGTHSLGMSVASTYYTERGMDVYVGPGVHTLALSYTNDYSRAGSLFAGACHRAVFVDTVTLYQRPFGPTSFAGQQLSPAADIDPESARYVTEMQRLVNHVYPTIGRMPISTATTSYSVPVYTVPDGYPTVKVAVTQSGADGLQPQMNAVPLPSSAKPAQGTDSELVVWQPSTGRLWEFWGLAKDLFGHWSTGWGGYIANVHTFPAHFGGAWPQTTWGTSASGIELLGGLQRIDELKAGVIEHAVSVHLPAIDNSDHRWPAQRQDPSPSQLEGIIREGMRFRLPATLNIDALGLSPYATMVAKAIQRYGMVVTDHTINCICFQAEDPTQFSTNPYTGTHGIFGARKPDFTGFPWADLQLLAVPPDPQ